MATEWYVCIDSVESGPITSDRLKRLADEGKIHPDTLLKKGPSGGWVPASRVKGLFDPPVTSPAATQETASGSSPPTAGQQRTLNCPACGRLISREAVSCPGCGHPINMKSGPFGGFEGAITTRPGFWHDPNVGAVGCLITFVIGLLLLIKGCGR